MELIIGIIGGIVFMFLTAYLIDSKFTKIDVLLCILLGIAGGYVAIFICLLYMLFIGFKKQ